MNWVTDKEWTIKVLNAPHIVLVLFSSKESVVCKSEFAVLEKWKRETGIEVEVFFLDVYTSPIVALNYRISILPTLIIFQSGNKIFEEICKIDLTKLNTFIQTLLKSKGITE
jgi:thioredoxin-like negative regulator of GroEL